MFFFWACLMAYPQYSCSVDVKIVHPQIKTKELNKTKIKKNIKYVNLPKTLPNMDIGDFFANPEMFGEDSEMAFRKYYQAYFDNSFAFADLTVTTADYEKFKRAIQPIYDLIQDREYKKRGNRSIAYKNTAQFAFLTETESEDLCAWLAPTKNRRGRLFAQNGVANCLGAEGLTVRSRIMDESIFESETAIKIVVGAKPDLQPQRIEDLFVMATTVDDLNISHEFLERAERLAKKRNKPIEIIVVGTGNINVQAINTKVEAILEKIEDQPKEPQLQKSLMGSVGGSFGWHHTINDWLWTLRLGLDHVFGFFRDVMRYDLNHDLYLGWGFYGGFGLDYKIAHDAMIGIEGGWRLNQLLVTEKNATWLEQRKKSVWFASPYLQASVTKFLTEDYAVSFFVGHMFSKSFAVDNQQVSVKSLYSGIRFSVYF